MKNFIPINTKLFPVWKNLESKRPPKKTLLTLTLSIAALIGIGFTPWTQNIETVGAVISIEPDSRPTSIESIISGRIEKWFVKEGDYVHQGDTILFISEVKAEYFDPNLVENTQEQINAKEQAVNGYMQKVKSLDLQIDALISGREVKFSQTKNKIEQGKLKIRTDSTDYLNGIKNTEILTEQFKRYEELFNQNLISKTELEARKIAFQNANTKLIELQNKLQVSRNELANLYQELGAINADYNDKIAKSESEKFATISALYNAEGEVTKLQNQFINYDKRRGLYYIIAPQNGFVSRTTKSGIGQTIKEGEEIIKISPREFEHGIEIFVSPSDISLVHQDELVSIIFDGYPAFVINGWQGVSAGVYKGKIISIDPSISENGKFRVLVVPNVPSEWPKNLYMGGGAKAILLLNDVPLAYELWRKFNNFPPDYYKPSKPATSKEK